MNNKEMIEKRGFIYIKSDIGRCDICGENKKAIHIFKRNTPYRTQYFHPVTLYQQCNKCINQQHNTQRRD